ncbi:MAG TPA: phosphatase PAP2 family protein [Bacillota bacterium]|jgi:undecaprenyl-diphosphatase
MGVQIILWLQHFSSPVIDSAFRAISDLGSEAFYLAAVPIVFWSLNKRLGIGLTYVFLFSSWANAGLKGFFTTARPAVPVRNLYPESAAGYAFPSGHAQGSAAFWGFLATQSRSRLFSLLAGLIIVLVGLSRVYLGVHWPADVIGGTALGLGLSFVYAWLSGVTRGRRAPFAVRLVMGILVPLVMLFVYRGPDGPKIAGFLLGMAVGWAFEERFVGFRPEGPFWAQVFKVAVGLGLLLGLRVGLKLVVGEGLWPDLGRYSFLGLWGAFIWPLIFVRLGLAQAGPAHGGPARAGVTHPGSPSSPQGPRPR